MFGSFETQIHCEESEDILNYNLSLEDPRYFYEEGEDD
jgi:hypothetical protein